MKKILFLGAVATLAMGAGCSNGGSQQPVRFDGKDVSATFLSQTPGDYSQVGSDYFSTGDQQTDIKIQANGHITRRKSTSFDYPADAQTLDKYRINAAEEFDLSATCIYMTEGQVESVRDLGSATSYQYATTMTSSSEPIRFYLAEKRASNQVIDATLSKVQKGNRYDVISKIAVEKYDRNALVQWCDGAMKNAHYDLPGQYTNTESLSYFSKDWLVFGGLKSSYHRVFVRPNVEEVVVPLDLLDQLVGEPYPLTLSYRHVNPGSGEPAAKVRFDEAKASVTLELFESGDACGAVRGHLEEAKYFVKNDRLNFKLSSPEWLGGRKGQCASFRDLNGVSYKELSFDIGSAVSLGSSAHSRQLNLPEEVLQK